MAAPHQKPFGRKQILEAGGEMVVSSLVVVDLYTAGAA